MKYVLLLLTGWLLTGNTVCAGEQEIQACMRKLLFDVEDNVTVGELRRTCRKRTPVMLGLSKDHRKKSAPGALRKRVLNEDKTVLQPFTLMAHKPSYLLFAAYNDSGYLASELEGVAESTTISLDNIEAQFQLSIKFPLMVELFDGTADIFAAYTNRSFWQVYNEDLSSPFRETNHEPEIWLQFHPNWELFGFTNTWNSIGINHQSNGRGGALSRSWNRAFAWLTFQRGNLALSIKPWIRIPEDKDRDDNPDITRYLGHCQLGATYLWRRNVFSLMTRNNLESGFSRGAIEISWSFPFWKWPYLRGYIQYFNGYGESLLDYDEHINRIGVGVSLIDWL
ncbi:MAG: phospholipase [Desulfobulbus propionicus]|nr:MAG: phospholipase [Desulfobulbus propionicus]